MPNEVHVRVASVRRGRNRHRHIYLNTERRRLRRNQQHAGGLHLSLLRLLLVTFSSRCATLTTQSNTEHFQVFCSAHRHTQTYQDSTMLSVRGSWDDPTLALSAMCEHERNRAKGVRALLATHIHRGHMDCSLSMRLLWHQGRCDFDGVQAG